MLVERVRRKNHLLCPVGCLIFSCGAYLFIHSGLGTDPLDVFSLGLVRHLPVTVGVSQTLVAVVYLVVVAAWTLLACAVLLCAYGSALIIMSGFGIRAIDVLALAMTSRWNWPFWTTKGLIETSLMISGFLMGGPLGIGTVCFLVGVDLLIQPLITAHYKIFRISRPEIPERSVQTIR
ncbi:hypothetical protein ACFXJM_08020 [Streptomyces massasporeus]